MLLFSSKLCRFVDMEREIEKAIALIRRGYPKERIIKKISKNLDAEEVYEVAKCRIKIKDKFSKK
ncbi:TPA: methyltransferase type 11, partial [Candidatus Aciduliprofundum boonei]|nr:methyltransferase type 11 [Candidatus Aciduliprofundum boonei]